MDIGNIFDAGLNAASGGVLGFLGSIGAAGLSIWKMKLDMQDRALQRTHDLSLAQLTGKQATDLANVQGSWAGLAASQSAAAAITGTHGWVSDLLAVVRPALTIALVCVSVWIIARLKNGELMAYIPPVEAAALLRDQINSISFLTGTAVAWWFGDRSQNPSTRRQ